MAKLNLIFFFLLLSFTYSCAQNSSAALISEAKNKLQKAKSDTGRADLLCKLALLYVYKPGENKTDLDSAILLLKQAEALNNHPVDSAIQARIYFAYANTYREAGSKDVARQYIDKAITSYEKLPASCEAGEAYMELSNYNSQESTEGFNKTREYYNIAALKFEACGNKERQAYALKYLGDVNQILRNYGEAMGNLQQSLVVYQSINYKDLQGVYDLLGIVSTCMGDRANAIKYGLLAVKTAEDTKDSSMQLCTIYNRLSIAYNGWYKYEEAMIYAQKAIDVAIRNNDRSYMVVMLPNVVYLLNHEMKYEAALKLSRETEHKINLSTLQDSVFLFYSYATSYQTGKDYSKAGIYINKLIHILDVHKNGLELQLELAYRSVILFFMELKDYKMAQQYNSRYFPFLEKRNSKASLPGAYLYRSRIDSGLGNYKEALANYQEYKRLKDSAYDETKSMQFAQMLVLYETEKKDKNIALNKKDIALLTGKTQLQEVNIKKANLTRNIVIGASVFLLTLFYVGYRYKQRHNEKLQLQQDKINNQNIQLKSLLAEQQKLVSEKEWLVKEIHHRVKNNLQIVISLLNAQADFLDNPSALNAIQESRERMQAIALIHQKLYQPDQNNLINMNSYINEMVANLRSGFINTSNIKFQLDIDDIEMEVSQAVPLGLIMNEAITNSVKYAFLPGKAGLIKIILQQEVDGRILLRIADNGKGLPPGFDASLNDSLGIQLINLFAEQLEAELQFINDHGVDIVLRFKLLPMIHAVSSEIIHLQTGSSFTQ
ncbi:MAG: sensor histidine kinase [Ferruginibacter sp.]